VNCDKTKIMTFPKLSRPFSVVLDGQQLQQVTPFKWGWRINLWADTQKKKILTSSFIIIILFTHYFEVAYLLLDDCAAHSRCSAGWKTVVPYLLVWMVPTARVEPDGTMDHKV